MRAMRPLRIACVLSLSLMVAGALVAHAVAYRLVNPAHHLDGHMYAEEAHGYLGDIHACLAICGAVAFLAAFASLLGRLRSGRALLAPLWAFAVVPPLGFTIQEHLEHVLETGSVPHTAALDPAFLVGLLLQLPFAFAAYFAGRVVLAVAVAIVETFRAAPPLRLVACDALVPTAPTRERPRLSLLALGYGQRAPPPRPA
jgi:hypothetical protein